ncbi:MAG TPA: hypothetical protein VLI41_12430 [Phenylobacterium sp.]|uniref:hypothetical protein n=1 Tax=Phenylobacterium sp. TaxID=1871053 RepID=UPI002B6B197B|nr:hypothetical protein [Phenylobacterium sp.]HSV04001.1 hypothetical protein [Phenylobacterium sp.]
MRDSERYMAQAEAVLRMAARAGNPAEKQVYETIAQGWRKLAAEAKRNEQHEETARAQAKARASPASNN